MENKTHPEKEKNDFQTFTTMDNLSKIFVSKQLLDELRSEERSPIRFINKYLSIDSFLKSISHRYFYLASPSKWEDPFETKYLDILDGPKMKEIGQGSKEKLKEMSIYCSCMTYNDSDNEEASWKSYGENKEQIIRVSYDFDKLCEILDRATDGKIYVGKVNYKSRKDILNLNGVINESEEKNDSLEVLYVNNFCLKQEAYQYEKELRFCKIEKGDEYKKQDDIIIDNVDLAPAIVRITLPPINHNKLETYESMSKNFDQIKKYLILKVLCPEASINVSNLYDSSKDEMTSELKL